jgi:hypothetical protein
MSFAPTGLSPCSDGWAPHMSADGDHCRGLPVDTRGPCQGDQDQVVVIGSRLTGTISSGSSRSSARCRTAPTNASIWSTENPGAEPVARQHLLELIDQRAGGHQHHLAGVHRDEQRSRAWAQHPRPQHVGVWRRCASPARRASRWRPRRGRMSAAGAWQRRFPPAPAPPGPSGHCVPTMPKRSRPTTVLPGGRGGRPPPAPRPATDRCGQRGLPPTAVVL